MTSTNDGKDVKSNQTSGHKSKSYYIELYTSLEKALSGDGSLEQRTAHVCEAWRRVYSLYQHSATSTHPHLLSWLQRHTANTVLQSKWAKSKNEQTRLTNAIDALVAEATEAAAGREQYPWEKLLLQRAAWFRKAVENPWDNPVLKSLINPNSEPVTDEQVLEWLISEHGIVLVSRLQHMVSAGNCDDLALRLASAVMDRARAAKPHRADDTADDRVEEDDHLSFVAVLEREAGFTAEEWEMLTDIELVLLLKTDKRPRCIELAKLTPLRHGYKMVERLRKRLEMSPRDKKLWKHAKEAATLVAQMVIARCMVVAVCAGAAREALYWCARALARLVAATALRPTGSKLAAPAKTARHLHTFCAALIGECKELKTEVIMKPFICELYVRAINSGIYELEKLKLVPEKEAEARLYEQTLAGWYMQLGGRLTDSARLRAECSLTAFSVHPSDKHYQRVASTPQPPGLQATQEPTPETTSEYGSWANDSRTQSNLVKTSETLQLKQSQQHQANVLSTAILTEGEALGLETVLCQDLAVILSGPRVKTLSWDMDREVLLENCRTYMEKTHGGTRAVTTELKYLNLDPEAYRHLPEEGDDESDLYYGIEKGYEHEVQFEEPGDIWQNGFLDPEQTESANDSEVERQMKKKSKAVSSEDDEDPLSNIAEAKREKKKIAKEKSKERKKSHKRDVSKDGSRERRKDKDKKTKKERKKKSEQPTPGSLTSLLGMKVSKMSAQVQDGEKRVRKKKERRREPKTMFSYVSVTDSDYDSQVKSQVSGHDPNVLVDGVFSMDELRSPEKTIDSQKPIDNIKTTINNAPVQSPVIKDNKTRPMSSPHSTASDSDVSRSKSPYLTPNQLGPRHVVGSKVKSSIAKLLQFRRNKSQVREVPRPPPSRTPTNPSHSLVGMKIYKPEDVSKVYLNQSQCKQLEAISKEVCDLISETSSSVNYRTAPETDRLQNQNLYNVKKYQQQYGNPHRMPQTYNESQKHGEYTQHSPIRPAHQVSCQSPSSVIHTNYTSPIKTPEHKSTHALNLSPPKPTMTFQPFHKSMQNLSTETKYDPPKKPQLINDPNYFIQQLAKSNSSPLSPRIISNTCIKPASQKPIQQYSGTVKKNTANSQQTFSNMHGTNTPRGPAQTHSQIADSKKDVRRDVQKQLSSSMQNISEVPGRYGAITAHIPTPNTPHGQASKPYSVKSQNDASNHQALYNSNNTTASRCLPIQHRDRADKTPQKPNINFEEYLKELVKSISESNGHDKNRTIALNKDVKVTHVPSSTATVKRVDSVTPQCAKQLIQQKKTENAPNTFSRRSYMHKNKQSENKVSLTDSITLEMNRTMMDHKISKAKCMKNEVTISRVVPNKQDPVNVFRKLEQPCSRLQRDCPVLSSMLDASGTPKIKTVSNTANSNTSRNQPNREDADLLLLLRNQTVLKQNVSTLPALASDISGQALNNSQIKVEVSSAHQGLVGTKVKNIHILDTSIKSEPEEDKSEWKSVMDAIIAQKTEPLGPNALDLALKKQYRSYSQSSSRAHSSDKHRVSGQSSLHNKPVDPKKREPYSSKASSSRKPTTEKHPELPKKPREPEVIKKTTTDILNRPEILNKHFSLKIPKVVPQTPVIQNSDYDTLDELIDDDLRRELGEISSDEDAYSASDAALLKSKTQSNIPKTVTNVYKAAHTSKGKPHIVNPKTIPKNPNLANCNRRFATNTCPATGYPNVINSSSHPINIANKPTAVNVETRQHTPTSAIITNQVAQDTANNIVTSHIGANQFMRNILPANVIIASVPESPVVVIRQDLVYDPYPTIRIHESQVNTELRTVNKNMYAMNATPNIAVYQTTQYAAPVINPFIIGNAMTTTNVSNATAMGNDHVTPDRTKDMNKDDQDSISLEDAIRLTANGNQSPEKSTKCLKATISHSDDRSLTPEISTNLDFNMNRNCERKVLSQVQEKLPNDNVDKESHLKKSPDEDIAFKSDEDRIKLKRQSLMNRKISHAVDHPIIPLTYTPLTRKVNLEKQLQRETPKNGIVKPNLISIPNSTSDIEKSIVISTSEKSPQAEANNENIETTDQASSVKENQKSCRRIWLRSSNKLRNKMSPVKRPRVPLRRNKIKLKVIVKEALEKIAHVESESKDSVKSQKRVSNRILNKLKVIKPAKNQPPSQEAPQQNVAHIDELIDFEEALSGTIVLKSLTTMSGTENTMKEPKCNSAEVEKEESSAAVADEQHTKLNSIEDTKVTTESNKTSDVRLEPKVVIEKLKSKPGAQLTVKRSSVKTPVNKAKVIVIKKNRPVLTNKSIIKNCIAPIEATSNEIIIKEAPNNTVSAATVPDNTNKLKPIVIIGQKVRKARPIRAISTSLVRVETNIIVDPKVIEHTSAISAPIPLDDKLKPALDDQIEASKLNLPAAGQKVTELITAASLRPVIETNETQTTDKYDVKVIESTATSSVLDLEKTNKNPIAVDDQKFIQQRRETRSRKLPVIEDETDTLKSTALDNRDVINQTSLVELPIGLNESNKSKPRAMGDQELIKHTESTPEGSTTEQKRHCNNSPDCIKTTELEVKNQSQTYKTHSTLSTDSEKPLRRVETKPSTVINKATKLVQSDRSVNLLTIENSTKMYADSTKLNETGPEPTCKLSQQASDGVINHVSVTQNNSEEVIDISEKDDVQPTTEVHKYNSNYEITNKDQQIDKSLLCQENTEVLNDDAAPKSDVGQEKQGVKQIIKQKLNIPSKPDNPHDKQELKALDNAKQTKITCASNNNKHTLIKGDIKVVELPVENSNDPSKKLVRITLPNGKIFRATIHGNIQGDYDSLFSDPRMRAILAGSLNDGKRYTVNYKQVSKQNKTNPTKPLDIQIRNLNVREADVVATPIDTVNLISDDEDEVPTPPTRSFTTEFGKYTTNADAETCTMHQNKFNQKCEVKMYREDIFKSNKTKPRNGPSGSTFLIRNKSKLLSTASAQVVCSTATTVIPEVVSNPEISTQAQETHILAKTTEVGNVIAIDDSSNDSIDNPTPKTADDINLEPVKKLVELKSLLLSDLGVGIEKNITLPLPKEKAVNNLKSALLQDLGLVTAEDSVIDITADDEKQDKTLKESHIQKECLDNNPVVDITQNEEKKVDILMGIQTQNNTCFVDDPVVQNDERDKNTLTERQEQNNLLKCVVKLVNCDNLIKKYELHTLKKKRERKTMKKCYVKLERLNNSTLNMPITSPNEKTNDEITNEMEETDEMNLDTDDFINFDDEEPSGSPQLSRCPSLSILNNWDDLSQPLEIPYPTSPVMEVYDTITQLRHKLKIELVRHPEKLLSLSCDSEWRMTKLEYSIEERLLGPSNTPSLENKFVPDNYNVLVVGTENLFITFDAPKLVTITLKFLENNPDVLYRLQSMRNLRRIFTTKTSPNKLKRKNEELVSDTVASKILKLGALALKSLNSCIKDLGGIRFSNIEDNVTAQPDASSIKNESSNSVIIESLPKAVTTVVEYIEENKLMDDAVSTSDFEYLVAECENHLCPSPSIEVAPVNEDRNPDTVKYTQIADSNMTGDRAEEKCKKDTQNSKESQLEKKTIDQCDNKEYSDPTVKIAVVHEEANSSEEIVPVISTTSPTGNRAEEKECKEGTKDSNCKPDESKTDTHTHIVHLNSKCENYEEWVSPAISVALFDEETNANAEETMAIVDSTSSPTGDRAEEEEESKEETQYFNGKPEQSKRDLDAQYENYEDFVTPVSAENDEGEAEKNTTNEYVQFENNEEWLTSNINDPFLNEDTNGYSEEVSSEYPLVSTVAYSEESVQTVDSNMSPTDHKTEEISDPFVKEDTDAYSEETVQTIDSDASPTEHTTEEINDPFVNETTIAYSEETVQIVDSDASPAEHTTEEMNDPFVNETTIAYSEETVQIVDSDASAIDHKTEEIIDPLVNDDSNAYSEDTVQTLDSDMSQTDHKTEELSDPFVNEVTIAYSEETVKIIDSDTSAIDHKTEEIIDQLVNEDCNAYSEETVQTVDSDMTPTVHKTEEISDPFVNEDAIASSEETVQIVDSDTSPTYHETEEKYDQETNYTGNFRDDISKEQSVPAHREPDLVSEENETIKIENNENTPVNTNLSVETSVSYLPSENSRDKNVTEDIHSAESPSPLSNSAESGDTETQISVNVSDEQTTTEVTHTVNSDRLDEIPIDEISTDVCEVEVVDTNIVDGIGIVETLLEKSQEPMTVNTVPNADSSEVHHQDSAINSPDFIDSKNIAFNYHDYTKQLKNKEVVTTSTINCRPDCEVNNDKDLLTECASETEDDTALKVDSKENSCRKETPTNHTEVNTNELCPLKSNPEFKYELIQDDDLLTVKITTENDKHDNETKTVFMDPNDAEEETVASLSSDEADDNIDIKGFEFEDMYVFPLSQSASNSNNTSNDSLGQESNSESANCTTLNDLHDIDFHVVEPEITYSRKRKIDMRDIRIPAKKYRKGKNIDCSKQTVISMAELAYGKEYKRLLEYCSSVKFSYTRPFHKECVEVNDLMTNWPVNCGSCDVQGDISEEHLFVDLHDISSYQPDPMTQTFVEEINYEYDKTDAAPVNPSNGDSEVNFNMGFGEGSGRVIQILKKSVSNISAATLSDVKQSQPVLKSVDLDDCNNVTTTKEDQIKKIRQYVNFIELRDKVRTFFKKSSDELKSDGLQKAKDLESKNYYRFSREEFPFDLCSLDYVKPLTTNAIVQVVQVGQLPVSAAAQNPVTCDPRVTQVSDASPSQCSVDNGPNDDSQSEIKTEYTELTTADLTLPLQGYAQQNQANLASNDSNLEITEQTISLEMEIKAEESPEIKKEMPDIKEEKSNSSDTDLHTLTYASSENMDYSFETNTAKSDANSIAYDSSEQNSSDTFSQHRQQNGTTEKTDQIAHAMNAAGITTTSETVTNTRAHALVNILSQKIRQGSVNTTQTTTNTYSKTTSINAMSLQQALAQILPPPLNQTGSSENNQAQSTPVGPQVLHIVQGKNASGNQITLVDNSQQSVISTPNTTQVLHIVQNKNANPGQASNGTLTSQGNSFSGLSLVDAGLQQGGNQLLHIVNTGNQKNASPGQLLKRVNLLTNLTNVQGSNEQKMVQFVCKSADGKAIQLNAPHQRSMVLRLQPIETPNVQTPPAKPTESQEPSPSPTGSASSKDSASQQEIKSRSIYEENYAKFIQNSSSKTPGLEKSTSLPKFNQAFGKPVFQEGQKQGEATNNNSHLPPVNANTENTDCSDRENAVNLEHMRQISSPPLLIRKPTVVTSASQPNIVQQIKQTIAPMNIQTMHGGVIYTRQIPVNIGGGQTINLITVPTTELINDDSSKSQAQNNQGEIEPSIIKIVPQSQTTSNNESSQEETNNHASGSNENAQTPQPQPVLTQMRIKLPMLSKAPQMVPGARVVRPSFFQIQRNVLGGNNQPVYQQLVLTAAPPLGQQTIRLPQAQASRPVKAPSESQSSSSESQMSTSTLEQLREFDMVLEQVKERSTVQPSTNSNNSSFKIHTISSDTTDGNGTSNCSTESTSQVLYSIGNNQSVNVAYVNRKASVTTPTTSTYVRSPDSSGIADSPTSSTHVQIPHTVTTDSSPTDMSQSKPAKVGSKSKSRPKSTSNPPNTLKLNSVPPKTSSQKPLEDEQTTQRILYILAEYKEQVENSPDKDKPAPRRRSNPPSNPGSSKRKKSSSSRRSGTRDMSPIHGEDTCRTMGSEDSSCGTSQGDCTESCLDSHSPQDSPRKVARKITFDQDLMVTQPRPQPQRNVIVADGQTITVARGATGKPATAVLMPANYILPVSMMKGGQQIAIVTNRGPKLLTVGGEGGATNALLLQRLIGPAGLKPVLTRPGVRHVRLPTAALHNLQAFNLATATTVQPPDSTASPTPGPTPPELVDTRATSSPWTDRDEVKPERGSSPEGSEPWNLPSSADAHEYTYEETVRTDNMDRTVLVVQKKDGSHRHHRLSHVSAAALRHKYAILEHELRLQKSLSEECEDLGVDSPSASELFPEAELLFAASPAHEHNQEHHSHTPQPHQSSIPQPDMDDQIATDHLIPREIDASLGLGDVGIVAVSEDGSATIALDQEEFARSHPNTTFHSEPTEGEVQPFTITGLKGRHITSTIFHSNSVPATVLMTAPQATVISQAPDHSVKYEIENMINSMPSSHNNDINLSSVLVKDDGLTRFDNILTDSRELHLTNTASAIVHSSGNATQVIRRVCYEDDKRERDARYLIDEPDNLIAGDDAKMIAEDSSRDATLESMADVDDDRSSPERHAELFWESNSASERSESRRPLDFSSDSDKCCKSPSFDETNSTDSSGVGSHLRLDSVIKEARTWGSLDGSSAEEAPPLRTYPAKRSVSGKTRAGERAGHAAGHAGHAAGHAGHAAVRRRASGRGVVKRGCHCCSGEPAPPRPKKPRQRKPTLDFHATN